MKSLFIIVLWSLSFHLSAIPPDVIKKQDGRLRISGSGQAGSGVYGDYNIIDNTVYYGDQKERVALCTNETAKVCFSFVSQWLRSQYPKLAEFIDKKSYPRFSHSGHLSPFISKFTNEFMQEVEDPEPNDIIIYYDTYNERHYDTHNKRNIDNHFGIMISKDTVRSKWGIVFDNVFDHTISNVPKSYGPYLKFYRLKPEFSAGAIP